jgi:hypothetical protein
MPDTFLIDREGRVAAAYMAGLVHRENSRLNSRRFCPNTSVRPTTAPFRSRLEKQVKERLL